MQNMLRSRIKFFLSLCKKNSSGDYSDFDCLTNDEKKAVEIYMHIYYFISTIVLPLSFIYFLLDLYFMRTVYFSTIFVLLIVIFISIFGLRIIYNYMVKKNKSNIFL